MCKTPYYLETTFLAGINSRAVMRWSTRPCWCCWRCLSTGILTYDTGSGIWNHHLWTLNLNKYFLLVLSILYQDGMMERYPVSCPVITRCRIRLWPLSSSTIICCCVWLSPNSVSVYPMLSCLSSQAKLILSKCNVTFFRPMRCCARHGSKTSNHALYSTKWIDSSQSWNSRHWKLSYTCSRYWNRLVKESNVSKIK